MRLYLKETSVSFSFLEKAKSGRLVVVHADCHLWCDLEIWVNQNDHFGGGDGGGSGEFLTLDFKGEISKRAN